MKPDKDNWQEEYQNEVLLHVTTQAFGIKLKDYLNWFELLRAVVCILRFLKVKFWVKLSNPLRGKFSVISLIFDYIRESSFISSK